MYNEIDLDKIDITKEPPETEPERQYYFIRLLQDWAKERKKALGRPLYANITTFGCQMNARDSEKILGIMQMIGYEETDSEEADFLLYNTCTVRENANLKVYGRLGHLKGQKEKNPDMVIALCGCMMQEKEVVEKIEKSYRNVDLIFGTHNIFKLAELLSIKVLDQRVKGKMLVDVWDGTTEIVENLPNERKY
ncbi:MAG TPA: tRNA (N6-isopentenyl adenosine(37)-C2)-methylthiotransferase MiaB, partial [Lachnospiraceae bacterium]|nr:tRNA (N6-isopentenyl adenosine(37)-C2)-methylthiotransferase MiaB [Lachnospiraceae bacterium]